MQLDLLEMVRVLSSFAPGPRSLADAPWDQYVDWAISQGLAPLAAYNLEYRLGGGDAPEWARDRLLAIYQGSVNDNVMKLVNFKHLIQGFLDSQILVLGGAAFIDSLYPHVAFRPLLDIRLRLNNSDLDSLEALLSKSGFKETGREFDERLLSDGRTLLVVQTSLLGLSRSKEEAALVGRALPMNAFGPCAFRPSLEDAILVQCLDQARKGYEVPLVEFVDLRELLSGAPSVSGPYSRAFDGERLKNAAAKWGLDRALYASVSIAERLFPQIETQAQLAKPPLRRSIRGLLDRWIVEPVARLGRTRTMRGLDRLRRLLAVGGGGVD